MNREIKFRAWDSIAGKMWEDVYFDGGHIYTIGPDGENASTMPRWDDNVLMQYTGLKDKNGKDIYEGDIMNHDSLPGAKKGNPVAWVWGVFVIQTKLATDAITLCSSRGIIDGVVIGNIYENKELL